MKKTIPVLLTLCLLAVLCACEAQPQMMMETPVPVQTAQLHTVGLQNPMVERSSLEEINNLTGMRLARPPVMGVNDKYFGTIDCGDYMIAQYRFEVAGVEYTLRGSPMFTRDISGVYGTDGPAFPEDPTGELEFAEANGMKLARWITVDGQYVLMAENPSDIFESAAEEIRFATVPADSYGMTEAEYIGEYQDSFSQRAGMSVEDNGGDGVKLTVHWSSSAFEYNEWTMTARLDAEGRLAYTDGREEVITVKEDGTETRETVGESMSGWFTPFEGQLLWDGAPEESCRDCAFVAVQ